jgi:hypothetical protein
VESFETVEFGDGLALLFKFLALFLELLLHLLIFFALLVFHQDQRLSSLALNFPKLALALFFSWIFLRKIAIRDR